MLDDRLLKRWYQFCINNNKLSKPKSTMIVTHETNVFTCEPCTCDGLKHVWRSCGFILNVFLAFKYATITMNEYLR